MSTLKRTKQLQRGKPLKARPRAKGNRGELAIRDLLRDQGWTHARRNWQSGGQGGGDIINGPVDVSLEVKWCEEAKPWAWLRQCEGEARPTDIPVVVCRCNDTPWFAVLPADEWDALLELDPRPTYTVVCGPGRRLSWWPMILEAIEGAKIVGASALPVLRFSRAGSPVYVAVPFGELLSRLWMRERGL